MNCHKQIKDLEPTNLTKISYHRSTKKGHTGSKVVQPIRIYVGTPDILPYAILVLLRLYVHFACACVFGASGKSCIVLKHVSPVQSNDSSLNYLFAYCADVPGIAPGVVQHTNSH